MTIAEALQLLELPAPVRRPEVKRAYREAMLVWHPDRFDAKSELRAKAEARSCRINEAFSLLNGIPDSEPPFRTADGRQASTSRHRQPTTTTQASRPRQQSKASRSEAAAQTPEPDELSPQERASVYLGLAALVALIVVIAVLLSPPEGSNYAVTTITSNKERSTASSREFVFTSVFPPPPQEPKVIELQTEGRHVFVSGGEIEELFSRAGNNIKGSAGSDFILLDRIAHSGSSLLHAYAEHLIGMLFINGNCGVSLDYAKAKTAFERSALLGYGESQFELGCLYRDGRGVAANLEEAYVWFAVAKEAGAVQAESAMKDDRFSSLPLSWKEAMLEKARLRCEHIRNAKEVRLADKAASDQRVQEPTKFPGLFQGGETALKWCEP